ncbi:hypothetical protein CJ430_31250, partial [Klebsiella pneumoniae]
WPHRGAPAEIPVGLLTSLLGAPWFLWLVFRRENILLLPGPTPWPHRGAPAEIPVGLLTSLLGAPWFLWLVFRREN